MKVTLLETTSMLEAQRDFAEAIIRTVTQPLLVLDDALCVIIANDSFYSFFNVSNVGTVGMSLYELGNGQWNIPELKGLLEDILPHRRVVENYQVRHTFESIGEKTLLLNARTLQQKNNKPNLILLAFQDVTSIMSESVERENVAVENQRLYYLEQDNKRLKEVSRNKDEFVSLTSHQLRTPATIVKQHLGMVLDGFLGDVPKGLRPYIQVAYDSNERQLKIVNDILRISLLDMGKIEIRHEMLDIVAIVNDAIKNIGYRFEERNQTLLPVENNAEIYIEGDKDFLVSVFENVLLNASDYSYEDSNTKVTLANDSDSVTITIEDQGVGIDPNQANRLFDRFERIPNPLSIQAGGTGLGLYWAKKIVELHEGSITIQPAQERGTIVTVSLPIAKP